MRGLDIITACVITACVAGSLLAGCAAESSRPASAAGASPEGAGAKPANRPGVEAPATEPALVPARIGEATPAPTRLVPTDQASSAPGATPIAPTNYAGYLFVYFTGEANAQGEQIHFALSRGNDPLHWQELNGAAPVLTSSVGTKGVRDPFILRAPDNSRFYLIATDLQMFGNGNWDRVQRQGSQSIVVWESTDLVQWSEARLVRVAPASAGNTWAPEAFYDRSLSKYLVFWASAVYAADDLAHTGSSYNRMLFATTTDFRAFSPPAAWYDPGHAVIDSTLIEAGGIFYRFTKDERRNAAASPCGKFIRLERARSLTTTQWELVAECIGQGTISRGEGPLVFKSNTAEKWYLFLDEFGGRGYVPFESSDLSSGKWVGSPEYSLPPSPRHGTVLPVSAAEHQRLLAAYKPN